MRRVLAIASLASIALGVAFSGCTCGPTFNFASHPFCCWASDKPTMNDDGCRAVGGWSSDSGDCPASKCLNPACANWQLVNDDHGCEKWESFNDGGCHF